MKEYRSPDGELRLWYEANEIEQIMEDELRRAGLLPTPDRSVVDVESLIEGHLKATLDQYAELPPDVLGLTQFDPRRAPTVRINKELTGTAMDSDWCPPGIEGRWRATLGHEAAHIILHRILFDEALNQGSLFPREAESPRPMLQRCLKRDLTHRRNNSDWREVQANRGMAALSMPKGPFVSAAQAVVQGSSDKQIVAASRALATQFGVSGQAAMIRLQTFGFVREDQAELSLSGQ